MTRLAVGQAAARPGDVAANAATAAALVDEAAAQHADVLVLPEAFLTGYAPERFDDDLLPREQLDGPALEPLRAAAARGGLSVAVGAALGRPGESTLSLVLIGADGAVRAAYDKQHLDGAEKRHFTRGRPGARLLDEPAGLAPAVCYDACFPEHARAAARAGAVGYLVAGAWFVGGEHRRDLHHASRALENGMYVAFAGLTGACGAARFGGGSAIFDPEGRRVVGLGAQEGVVSADLDAALVRETRARHTMLADAPADARPPGWHDGGHDHASR